MIQHVDSIGGSIAFLAGAVLPWLLFRALPVAAYAVVSAYVSWREKLYAATGIILLFFALRWLGYKPWFHFGSSTIIYVYFLGASFLIYKYSSLRFRNTVYFCILLLVGVSLSLYIPGRLFPRIMRLSAVAFGWEFLLASISYSIDAKRQTFQATWKEVAFFLLVNPVLVWSDRGQRLDVRREHGYAFFRVVAGIVGFWAAVGLRSVALWFPRYLHLDSAAVITGLLAPVLVALAEYPAHTGRASLQIGLLRLLGWQVPERYIAVYRARSPSDFWRRWNRYVSRWAERYLFHYVIRMIRRRTISKSQPALIGIAVSATFLGLGLIHDLPRWIMGSDIAWLSATGVFLLNGVVLLIWEQASRAWHRGDRQPENGSLEWKLRNFVTRVIARIFLLGYLIAMGAVLVPMLAS